MQAVIIGDSMVDGSPLAKRLGELLSADGYAVTQAGLGATSADSWDDGDVITRPHKSVDSGALPKGADLLIISLGTNDGANANRAGGDQKAKAEKTAQRISKIAQFYGAARTIWVLPPWMRGNVEWYTQEAMEPVYAAAPLAQGVELFDSRAVTKDAVMAGSGDGGHPGAKLQREWADAVYVRIKEGGKSNIFFWIAVAGAVAVAILLARRKG